MINLILTIKTQQILEFSLNKVLKCIGKKTEKAYLSNNVRKKHINSLREIHFILLYHIGNDWC